jgi:hypothetical protein
MKDDRKKTNRSINQKQKSVISDGIVEPKVKSVSIIDSFYQNVFFHLVLWSPSSYIGQLQIVKGNNHKFKLSFF